MIPRTHNIVRILSKRGICSRKQAIGWVFEGRVTINGREVRDPGQRVKSSDRILVDGKTPSKKEKIYILMNKPRGYVTTRKDERGRKTVYDLLSDFPDWVFPVGRLDQDSGGLLLFTNDTLWADKFTDPRNQTSRTYKVTIERPISEEDLMRIREGMVMGRGDKTRPARIKILEQDPTFLEITLTEGKNREVRRIFETLGKPVKHLTRTRFGAFHLGSLKPGEWRKTHAKSASFSDPQVNTESRNPARRIPWRSQ